MLGFNDHQILTNHRLGLPSLTGLTRDSKLLELLRVTFPSRVFKNQTILFCAGYLLEATHQIEQQGR